MCDVFDRDDTPFRVHMVPRIQDPGGDDLESEVARVRALRDLNTGRLAFHDHVKLFSDGGFFAELMQVQPRRVSSTGTHGEWLMAPERFEALARAFWNEGYRIHVHCTGDLGLELAIEVLANAPVGTPALRPPLHHRALRAVDPGAGSSPRTPRGLGLRQRVLRPTNWPARTGSTASDTSARPEWPGSARWVREGIPLALHSDFTMAPAQPLNHAWVAVNRICDSGEVAGPEERLTLEQAMRAITINAAFVLGMEDDIGSIRAGKRADFTVLEADPFEEPVETLEGHSDMGHRVRGGGRFRFDEDVRARTDPDHADRRLPGSGEDLAAAPPPHACGRGAYRGAGQRLRSARPRRPPSWPGATPRPSP